MARCHNQVERELGEFGDYSLVADVGAKSAENAARIACVFHVWQNKDQAGRSMRYGPGYGLHPIGICTRRCACLQMPVNLRN
ncbi:DUF3987 domain-containing protein [Thiohalophilus sp.]|uniref:DUF3987 domain-containing protein n=1 Tax=Thiohalophilus sp. TaxID=3028392 RepID=UPI003A10342E